MDTRPPELIERLVDFLVPPAVREEIAGDLRERYRSPSQFLTEAMHMLPFLIAGRIRRNTNFPLLAIQAFLLFFCFGGFVSTADAVALDIPRWLRATVPALAAIAGLVLRDAYRRDGGDAGPRAAIDIAAALICVLLSQAVLAVLSANGAITADWILSPRRAIMTAAGLPMLLFLRLAADYFRTREPDELTVGELDEEFGRFESGVLWRNRAIAAGGAAGAGAAVMAFLGASELAVQAGWAISIALGLSIAGYVFYRTSVTPMPQGLNLQASIAFYKSELERQGRLLRTIWWWYLLSIVPAAAGSLIARGAAPAPGAFQPQQIAAYAAICVLVGWLYVHYARRIEARIRTLAAAD